MKYKIVVFHVYQDKHNPSEQEIILEGGYAIRYALFMALIDSGKDFVVEIAKEKEQ